MRRNFMGDCMYTSLQNHGKLTRHQVHARVTMSSSTLFCKVTNSPCPGTLSIFFILFFFFFFFIFLFYVGWRKISLGEKPEGNRGRAGQRQVEKKDEQQTRENQPIAHTPSLIDWVGYKGGWSSRYTCGKHERMKQNVMV